MIFVQDMRFFGLRLLGVAELPDWFWSKFGHVWDEDMFDRVGLSWPRIYWPGFFGLAYKSHPFCIDI
jgi:hypothetical protein